MKENILFIILISPLYFSFYNRINGVEQIDPPQQWEQRELLTHNFDHMSFPTAFRLSRSFLGADGIFEWRGKCYTTLYKEEI